MWAALARLFSFEINGGNLAVRVEQIRERLRSYPELIVSQLLVAAMLVALLWNAMDRSILLWWGGVLFVELMLEAYYAWRDVGAISTLEECRYWCGRLILSVALAAVIWGVGGFLMLASTGITYQALVLCVFLGLGAGAATSNPVFPPSLYIFITLMTWPLVLACMMFGDRDHMILAGLLMVYWGFLLKAGRELGGTFELSLQRALENESLVGQLTEEKQRAEQASQVKSRFLAAASHDLRQPVHALALLVEALKIHVQDEAGRNICHKVEISVEALSNMLNTLLDVSRLDAGAIKPCLATFSLKQLLNRLHDEFEVFAIKQGLTLEVSGCDVKVHTDAMLLELVLRNLLSNALRHTHQGSVSLLCRQIEGGVQLVVQDTGVGIAPEFLPHIFEEYYQVGNQQRDRRRGLGLGLSIVKRLDQLLGLHLQVSSVPDVGTNFVMVIPLPQADDGVSALGNQG
ncbi:MAG: HAMP domain-containing sensor histidine kinase [Gallionella sp.]|nr:HAMP domain-containing sensor histidine kinase [Gallionella sp.]MDD4946286.1 HAMP domain-containing sensor histidine kinase [Gallionella sp.]MDD5612470.1 HAMP domain-containing sensor histidine kinase [Gallionella sp.]